MEKSQTHEYVPNHFTKQVVILLRTYPPRIEPNKLVLEFENLLYECQRGEVPSSFDVSEVFNGLLHSSINAAIRLIRK